MSKLLKNQLQAFTHQNIIYQTSILSIDKILNLYFMYNYN
jgi:hypothetical protein